MRVCKILGEHRDHSQHQEPLPGRAGINTSVTVFLTEPPGEFRGIFSLIASLRSAEECREENQKFCAGTEVEGKAKSSARVSKGVQVPGTETGGVQVPGTETGGVWPLGKVTCRHTTSCAWGFASEAAAICLQARGS